MKNLNIEELLLSHIFFKIAEYKIGNNNYNIDKKYFKILELGISLNKNNRESCYLKSLYYYDECSYYKALHTLKLIENHNECSYYKALHTLKLIENHNEDYAIYNLKGNLLEDLGKYDEAIEIFDFIIKNHNIMYAAHFNKGIALKNKGDIKGALNCIKESYDIYNKYLYEDERDIDYEKKYNNSLEELNSL